MTYFILNREEFVIVLISSNKHFFVCYYDQFGNPPQFCMNFVCCFYLNMKVPTVFWLIWEIIWFLRYGPKTSRRIRIQDSLNYNFPQTSLSMQLISCMLLSIEAMNLWSHLIWKWSAISGHVLKNELNFKFSFCMS